MANLAGRRNEGVGVGMGVGVGVGMSVGVGVGMSVGVGGVGKWQHPARADGVLREKEPDKQENGSAHAQNGRMWDEVRLVDSY
jgi:hypothetical protein